jgi:hypothetical protein
MFTNPTLLALYAEARHHTDRNPRMSAARRAVSLIRRHKNGGRTAASHSTAATFYRRPS